MPTSPSTRLALVGPAGTDTIAQGDDQIRAIITQLEAVALGYLAGTAAGRPAAAAGNAKYLYFATDTGVVSWSTGSAWTDLNPKDAAAGTSSMRKLTALPGYEIGYDQFTAPVSVTIAAGGSDAGTTVLSCAAHTFDGAPVIARFSSPYVTPAVAASSSIVIALYEGATEIGRLCTVGQALTGGATMGITVPAERELRFTPSAGSHTYTVFATQSGGTGTIGAGPGGTNEYMPGFVRFTKV